MDPELRPQIAGGGAFVVLGLIVLLLQAPGLLGILMIVVGMVMLGLAVGGYPSLPAFFRDRGAGRRRPPR